MCVEWGGENRGDSKWKEAKKKKERFRELEGSQGSLHIYTHIWETVEVEGEPSTTSNDQNDHHHILISCSQAHGTTWRGDTLLVTNSKEYSKRVGIYVLYI